jgi:hypothetical protein
MHIPPIIFSQEHKLLISCAAMHWSEKQSNVIVPQDEFEINDRKFIELIDRHALAPLAFKCLHNNVLLTHDLKAQMKMRADINQLAALKSMSMIVRLQKKMDELKLRGVLLKGVPLASIYYGDIGLRHCGDIDLWVEKKGFDIISSYLTSLGYRSNLEFSQFNQRQVAFKYKTDHHTHFTSEDPALPPVIELHWKLRGRFGFFTFDPENPAIKYLEFDVGGVHVNILNHVDNFLFLCCHGSEHAWYRLKWLFDLPKVINHVQFNWDDVYERAIELHCLNQVKMTFLLLSRFLKIDVPTQFQIKLVDRKVKNQLLYIEHCIQYDGDYCDTSIEKARNLLYFLSINQRGFLNYQLILRYLTSERDWETLQMPEKLFFLYFPLRPFLIIWRVFLGRINKK